MPRGKPNIAVHSLKRWLAVKCLADTPTYRGYETYLGYYSAMTADHWTHLNQAGGSAKTCPSFPDMCLSNGTNLSALRDNSTYESTIFGDRSVALIEAHDVASPFFLYLAFHNEHDPHQAPLASVQSFPRIKDDTYKVRAREATTIYLLAQFQHICALVWLDSKPQQWTAADLSANHEKDGCIGDSSDDRDDGHAGWEGAGHVEEQRDAGEYCDWVQQ